MCASDCGTCESCEATDDYGAAWRNPAFRSPDDPPASTPRGQGATETRENAEQAPTDPPPVFVAPVAILGGGEA